MSPSLPMSMKNPMQNISPTPVRREKERVEQQKFKEKVSPPIEVKVSPITLPNQVGFVELSQLDKFIKAINRVRGCTTHRVQGRVSPCQCQF